jgi:hypothetical protein
MTEFNRNSFKEDDNNTLVSLVISVYVILVGVGLPLFVRDKYFDILIAKYYYYCACTITMFIILVVCLFIQCKNKDVFSKKRLTKSIFEKMTFTDYSVLVFYLISVISTITSDYMYESFWGNEGRFTGLFLITWYVLSYFCISRFWKISIRSIDFMIVSGIMVCIFGITDYFKLDVFNFKAPMVENQRNIFTSTIGNINTYTAYVGIIVALSVVLFSTAKELKKILFYFTSMVISFCALIMGVSDNAYLSLGALFAFLPIYLFKDSEGIKRYLAVLATFFSVIQGVGWINKYFGAYVIGIDSSFKLIIEFKRLEFLVIGLWIVVLGWYLIDYKRNIRCIAYNNKTRYLWLLFLLLAFSSIVYVLFDCNVMGNADRYGSLSSYLVFNDEWGTHRGFIWRNAMESYLNLPWWKKLVGYGPETFGILLLQKTTRNPYNELFDSAHNEYLHLLITVGFAGVISYLSFILGIIKRGIQFHINDPYVMAILFGIICYSFQAFVNLNLPIVAPVFWVLLGMASAKKTEKTDLLEDLKLG